MAKFEMTETREVNAVKLTVDARPMYWEDATVNSVADEDGALIPFRSGDCWSLTIDIDAGKVECWPAGVVANIHYKVCDEGMYMLLDEGGKCLAKIDGYVPSIMSPGGNGYGDYIIMTIDGDGKIANWRADLSSFEDQEP